MEIKITRAKQIQSFDELLEAEDEIYHHVCVLDTLLLRKAIEYDYNGRLWLWISDQAINRAILVINREIVLKDQNFINHIEKYYDFKF